VGGDVGEVLEVAVRPFELADPTLEITYTLLQASFDRGTLLRLRCWSR
jgi:hypothetical protein